MTKPVKVESFEVIGKRIQWYADADGEIEIAVYKSLHGFSPAFPAQVLVCLGLGSRPEADNIVANLGLAQLDALIGQLATARKRIVAAGLEAPTEEHARFGEIEHGGRFERPAIAPDGVAELVDELTAWVNSPRGADRAAAEVVAAERMADVLTELLKTAAGEWGVRTTYSDDETEPDVRWYAGDAAEREARTFYAELRGKALCENCPAEVDEDELTEAGEDGPDVCHACATALSEEFEATRYRCVGERTADQPGCGWTGTGAEVTVADGQTFCPLCVDASEAEKVEDEQPTEAPAGG